MYEASSDAEQHINYDEEYQEGRDEDTRKDTHKEMHDLGKQVVCQERTVEENLS